MTSFGVVARVRRVLSEQKRAAHNAEPTTCPNFRSGVCRCKVKIGHTGTLDPFATGLMILVVGKETKNAATYSKLDKVYEATIVLGQTSSTGDPEGEISELGSERVRELKSSTITEVLPQFVGEIQQTPPVYSAIKIGGQRAYKLARKGEAVEMPTRTISIYSLEFVSYTYPELRIRTHVSSGTYIRTLAEDIGRALGVGAYCKELRRTQIAQWHVEDAEPLQAWLERNDDGDDRPKDDHEQNRRG